MNLLHLLRKKSKQKEIVKGTNQWIYPSTRLFLILIESTLTNKLNQVGSFSINSLFFTRYCLIS